MADNNEVKTETSDVSAGQITMEFQDNPAADDAASVYSALRTWRDLANGVNASCTKELPPDPKIEDIIIEGDAVANVQDENGNKGRLFSTGMKRNGLADMAIVWDTGHGQILRDVRPEIGTTEIPD